MTMARCMTKAATQSVHHEREIIMKKLLGLVSVFLVIALVLFLMIKRPSQGLPKAVVQSPLATTNLQEQNARTISGPDHLAFSKLTSKWDDFTDFEKHEFATNFATRYKPALAKWCDAFSEHVPISPDSVTTSNFVTRVGTRPVYREYIFVVDGITLGIQDSKGIARVDYLNAPKDTGKMTELPNGGGPPISTTPISKNEVVTILAAESGSKFTPNEIRLIPSGYSGALNGGAIVNVGGDPDNAASWKYDMVFNGDGKLAYYLKGR